MHQDGVKAALPNTQKQTQGGYKIEETTKYGSTEKTEQNPRKRTKQNRDRQLSDAEFKTLVIGMLRELTEHGYNIREDLEFALSEIKKNPQGTNSEGKEAGILINNLEHKEEINTQPEPNEETRIQRTVG